MPKQFKSIDELDEALEKEFGITDEDVLEEESTEEEEEEELLTEEESEEVLREEPKDEDIIPLEESTVDKKEFAFGKLRSENAELKKKLDEVSKYSSEFEELARNLGFNDAGQLVNEYKKQKIVKEAESRNIDPKLYQQMKSLETEVEQMKREKEESRKQQGLSKFNNALESVAREYSLSSEERDQILDSMGQDGYTMEDLAVLKAPDRVLKGYISERIAQQTTQQRLAKEKKAKKLEEPKLDGSTEITEENLEDIIKKEMKEYAEANNLYYTK
jgi:hypothetical protein